MSGTLIHGENLAAMRDLASGSVDLIYTDPPWNTGRTFTVAASSGPKMAFSDVWRWSTASDQTFWALRRMAPRVWTVVGALLELHGRRGTGAYVLAMAERLLMMQRLLRPTGSIYLHADPTCGGILRQLLDGVFGPARFRSEVAWPRAGGPTVSGGWGAVHDTLLHYAAGDESTWNGDGGATDVWEDIADLGKRDPERTGYPVQKPERLVERVVLASSRLGDVVLDPHAGSGTTLVATELAGRRWIGIDRGAEAIQTTMERLRGRCPRAVVEVIRREEPLTD